MHSNFEILLAFRFDEFIFQVKLSKVNWFCLTIYSVPKTIDVIVLNIFDSFITLVTSTSPSTTFTIHNT